MPSPLARTGGIPVTGWLIGLLGAGSGCGRLDDISQLISPAVAQGIFVGLDLPEGTDLSGSGSDLLQYSAACSVFLAYIADPSELDTSPVEGANVTFRSAQNPGSFPLADQGEGKYLATAESGIDYASGDEAVVTTQIDGSDVRIEVETPDAPDVDVPTTLPAQGGFTVDLAGQGYDNVLVAVYDVNRGKLTYDNLPDDIVETYEYTHGEQAESVDVYDGAFLREGTYVVGIAGMRTSDPNTFTGVSQSLSAFMAGQFTLRFVQVSPL
ncbi:MAG: hypothetical protein EXR69_05715 [Myxococcales bacterium]|nr:hypothetical protein [Myxococcales bacterium]